VRTVVVIVSCVLIAVLLPEVNGILAGLKAHDAAAGNPELHVNVIVPFEPVCCWMEMLKFAGCPAGMVIGGGVFPKLNGPTKEKFAVTLFAAFNVT